ncbi:MAG: hypothetical protein AB7U83_16245 [Vicinamibacterales bacterium]
MTFTRSALVYLGVVGAFALGLAVGPLVGASRATTPVVVDAPPPALPPAPTADADVAVRTAAPRLERVPTASAAPVQRHVRLLLNRGTDVRKASQGFANAYQFITVAHAARNTAIPFVVLKHRVLVERQSLEAAIAALKPELDESAEVTRARAAARAELARLQGA